MNIPQKQSGSSLIEVMVALFVLGVGLLGILVTQVKSVKLNQNSYLYSQASVLVNDIYESMRYHSNPNDLTYYLMSYDDNYTASKDCSTSNCNEQELAKWQRQEWMQNVSTLLPSGQGEISYDGGTELYTISIRFQNGTDPDTGNPIWDTVSVKAGF